MKAPGTTEDVEVVPIPEITIVAFEEGSRGLSHVVTTFTFPEEGEVNDAVYGFVENGWTAITALLAVEVAKNNPELQPLTVQVHCEFGAHV